jgi:hypothetical protein
MNYYVRDGWKPLLGGMPIDTDQLHQPLAERIRQALDAFGRNRYPDCEGNVGKAPKEVQDAPAKLQQKVEEMKKHFKD